MQINTNKYIDNLIRNMSLIKPEEVPNIDLYMDQVTTFMESRLENLKRTDEDKILTKTMINNYAKNDLLPPPEKKKYSRDHILLLTFIYYFKSFLTIGDIKNLTSGLNEKYFHSDKKPELFDIYKEFLNSFPELLKSYRSDVANFADLADKCIDALNSDDEYLNNFFFICLLGLDVYMKKRLIESLIDDMVKEPS